MDEKFTSDANLDAERGCGRINGAESGDHDAHDELYQFRTATRLKLGKDSIDSVHSNGIV